MGLNPQIIQNWETDKKKIVLADYERKISTFFDAEDKNEQFQNLHKVLVKWAVLCGVKPLPSDSEIRLFVEYVAEHFYRLSILDIDNAFNLATAGKLDAEPQHYQSFSVIYIATIINSYVKYKGKEIIRYREEAKRAQKKPLTEEDKLQLTINAILDSHDTYKKEPYYNPFGYVSYDFLNNLGIIKISDEDKLDILKIAREKTIEDLKEKRKEQRGSLKANEIQKIGVLIKEVEDDLTGGQDEVIRVCKNLSLMHYYDFILKNNISLKDELLNAMRK